MTPTLDKEIIKLPSDQDGPSVRTIHFYRPGWGESISVTYPQSSGRRPQLTYGRGTEMFVITGLQRTEVIGLAEVAWLEADRKAVILLCGAKRPIICFDRIQLSITQSKCRMDLDVLRASLAEHYGRALEAASIDWACSESGTAAFWQKHSLKR